MGMYLNFNFERIARQIRDIDTLNGIVHAYGDLRHATYSSDFIVACR